MTTFSKMHGLGNDFVVISTLDQQVELSSEKIQRLADRHRGIGFDQLLLLSRSHHPDADFRYQIFNADGSEVAQCGNGARCVARFIERHALSSKTQLKLQTNNQIIQTQTLPDGLVQVEMGVPSFTPASIPMQTDTLKQEGIEYVSSINSDESLRFIAVSMGNPHAVILANSLEESTALRLGNWLYRLPVFVDGVNVGLMKIDTQTAITLRVIERGVGETEACGSGACAAVVAGRMLGLLDEAVKVKLLGGELTIRWEGEDSPVHMIGPAEHVFNGEF